MGLRRKPERHRSARGARTTSCPARGGAAIARGPTAPPHRSLPFGFPRHRFRLVLLTLCLASYTSGCCYAGIGAMAMGMGLFPNQGNVPAWLTVTLYQPERGLHEPTVVDLQAPNLRGTQIQVVCRTSDEMNESDAKGVCQKVAKMLRQQGAEAEAKVPREKQGFVTETTSSSDLRVEIQSKSVHSRFDNCALGLAICSCSLTPTIAENGYIHTIRVRGKDGTLLSENRLQSRFVQYGGCGVSGLNWLLDFFFRADEDKLGGNAAQQDFSNDFYRQIAQQTFNAKMRSEVLGLTPRRRPTSIPPAMAETSPQQSEAVPSASADPEIPVQTEASNALDTDDKPPATTEAEDGFWSEDTNTAEEATSPGTVPEEEDPSPPAIDPDGEGADRRSPNPDTGSNERLAIHPVPAALPY